MISDARFFSPACRRRVRIEFADDSGSWVDFNAEAPAGAISYYAAKRGPVRITLGTESNSDTYVVMADDLVLDNADWMYTGLGFWEQPLPLTLSGDHVFSSWYHRLVRIGFDQWLPDGSYDGYYERGQFLVSRVRRGRAVATITLVPLHDLLLRRSAATVKNGAEWYQGLQIGALIRKLALAASPRFSVDPLLSASSLNVGTLAQRGSASWGKCPGVLASGDPTSEHWVPRWAEACSTDEESIWIMCEIPSLHPAGDTAITRFNRTTGRWDVWRRPGDGLDHAEYLEDNFPLWAAEYDGTLYVACLHYSAGPWDPECLPSPYLMNVYAMPAGAREPLVRIAHDVPYWPCREAMRIIDGDFWDPGAGLYFSIIGKDHVSTVPGAYFGEMPALSLPQTMKYALQLGQSVIRATDVREGVKPGQHETSPQESEWGSTTYSPGTSLAGKTGVFSIGARSTSPYGTPSLIWYYHLTDTLQKPYRSQWNQLVWCGPHDLDWTWLFHRMYLTPDGSGATYDYPLSTVISGDFPLLNYCITAWALGPAWSAAGSALCVIICKSGWSHAAGGTNYRWGTTWIIRMRWTADGVEPVSVMTLTLDDPPDGSDTDLARTVVHFHTPQVSSTDTAQWVIGVVLNRANVSGQPYGLGIWGYFGGALSALEVFGDSNYTGPTSSRPFAGFTPSESDPETVYFTDESTGQLWSINVDGTTVTWTLQNAGSPLHGTEFCQPMNQGIEAGGTLYLGAAPASHGDVVSRYDFFQCSGAVSSLVRHVKGVYPLVQYGLTVPDVIENADFSDMTCWEAIAMLRQILYGYSLFVDPTGMLRLIQRGSGGALGELVPARDDPCPDLAANGIPVKGEWDIEDLFDGIKNAVEVVPFGPTAPQEPELQIIKGSGSAFGGKLKVSASTSRAMLIAITCVAGGDTLLQADPAKQCALIWRWEVMRDPVHLALAVLASASQAYVYVLGLTWDQGVARSGDQAIRVGDVVRVGDGTDLTITEIPSAYGNTAVRLNLSGAIGGTATSYDAYTEVTVTPSQTSQSSDGATALADACDDTTDTLSVADASVLNEDSVIKVDQEYMRVLVIRGDLVAGALAWSLRVQRGMYGTAAAAHSNGAAVGGYVATQTPGKLYAIGDTGVSFGIEALTADTSPETRLLCAGDGVLIRTFGPAMAALQNARSRVIDAASIGDPPDSGYGRCDFAIDSNRFISPVIAKVLAPAIVSDWSSPKKAVTGLTIPAILPRVAPGMTTQFRGGDFEIIQAEEDLENWETAIALRSVVPVESDYRLLWVHSFPDYCYSTWEITDLDPSDGHQDLIGVSWDNTLWILDPATGAVRHSYNPGTTSEANSYGYVCCVDVNGDGKKEIIWGSHDSYVRCMAYDLSSVLWSIRDYFTRNSLAPPYVSDRFFQNGPTPAMAGGVLTLYQTGFDGRVIAIRASDGVILHEYNTSGPGESPNSDIETSPAVKDIDGDGEPEIVIVALNKCICLEHDLTLKWVIDQFDTPGSDYNTSTAAIADIDGDGYDEIIFTGGHWDAVEGKQEGLFIVSRTGTVLSFLKLKVGGSCDAMPTVFDIDVDGNKEIFVNDDDGWLYCCRWSGGALALVWKKSVSGQPMNCSPLLLDVNGDGRREVVALVAEGKVLILRGSDGAILSRLDHGYLTGVEGTPTGGDINGDGLVEILVPLLQAGKLLCYQGGATFAGNMFRRWGAAPGRTGEVSNVDGG